jgi:uncharacterized membrane protein
MRKMISIAVIIALTAAAGATAAAAAGGQKYKTKTEECFERAKAKKFGVHFIKRDRWIRKCIRGDV